MVLFITIILVLRADLVTFALDVYGVSVSHMEENLKVRNLKF